MCYEYFVKNERSDYVGRKAFLDNRKQLDLDATYPEPVKGKLFSAGMNRASVGRQWIHAASYLNERQSLRQHRPKE